jgi:hypothetical protein
VHRGSGVRIARVGTLGRADADGDLQRIRYAGADMRVADARDAFQEYRVRRIDIGGDRRRSAVPQLGRGIHRGRPGEGETDVDQLDNAVRVNQHALGAQRPMQDVPTMHRRQPGQHAGHDIEGRVRRERSASEQVAQRRAVDQLRDHGDLTVPLDQLVHLSHIGGLDDLELGHVRPEPPHELIRGAQTGGEETDGDVRAGRPVAGQNNRAGRVATQFGSRYVAVKFPHHS